jgi:signal transduction histidine kinase
MLMTFFASRGQALRVIGATAVGLAALCGVWLACVFRFLEDLRRASEVQVLASRIRIGELQARRYEKDFMLRSLIRPEFLAGGESEHLMKHRASLRSLRADLSQLEVLVPAGKKPNLERIQGLVGEYDSEFQELVKAYRERGIRDQRVKATQASVWSALANAKNPEAAIERTFDRLSRQQEEYLSTRCIENAKEVLAGLDTLVRNTALASTPGSPELVQGLRGYAAALADCARIQEAIGVTEDDGLQGRLRRAINAVEPSIEDVLRQAVADEATARRDLVLGLYVACAPIAAFLVLAILFGQSARLRAAKLLVLNRELEEDKKILAEQHAQLLQAERLAAIGQMVTGLAHESGNAIQRSQACLDMLANRVGHVPRASELVTRIQDAQTHLQHLYEEVREYAAPVRLERREWALDQVLAKAWENLAPTRSGRDAWLLQDTGGLDLRCAVDHFAIEQVFRNVLENSLSACAGRVEVGVDWSAADLDGRPAFQVRLRDNGPGLNAEQRAKIFEPFYTTKTRGTGLGMAIARRLVEAHGGRIAVGTAVSGGAEIVVILPLNGVGV